MRRRLLPCLLFIAGASVILSTCSSHKPPSNNRAFNSSTGEAMSPTPAPTGEAVSPTPKLSKEAASASTPEQKVEQIPRSSATAESVTVLRNVFMQDIDSENETFNPIPMIVLQRGQTYRVEQRYRNNNYATLHAGFNKWDPTPAHPKGFWVFQNQDILHWSNRSGDNQGEGTLRAEDYPSGKCLISFWSHSEAVATDEEGSRYRYVPFTTWRQSSRNVQGRNTTVFTFEFRDKYTTATVTLYRLP